MYTVFPLSVGASAASGVVTRPRRGHTSNGGGGGCCPSLTNASGADDGAFQTLVFRGTCAVELRPATAAATTAAAGSSSCCGSAASIRYVLGREEVVRLPAPITSVRCPVYEPTSGAVFLVANGHAVVRLEGDGAVDGGGGAAVSLVAGNFFTQRATGAAADGGGGTDGGDGVGEATRFFNVTALAPDGAGALFVADRGRIRRLDVATGEVSTLPGCAPPAAHATWIGLCYDVAAGELWAATARAICRVDVTATDHTAAAAAVLGGAASCGTVDHHRGGGGGGGGKSSALHLVAGSWEQKGFADGVGTRARFTAIHCILAAAGGNASGGGGCRLFILDDGRLRSLNTTTAFVNTVLVDAYKTAAVPPCFGQLPGGGELFVGYSEGVFVDAVACIISGGGGAAAGTAGAPAARRQRQPSAALAELHTALCASSPPPLSALSAAAAAGGGSDGGASSAAIVSVRVCGDGGGSSIFQAHRGVLTAHSEYFRRRLDPAAGFGDSGGGAVTLLDADPWVFSWLLSYMYSGELHMPCEMLRNAAELAARLLLPAECVRRLQAWLLERVTPGSVLAVLMWAEENGMAELAAALRDYIVRHRRRVALEGMGELAARFPDTVAALVRELAAAL